MDVSVRTGSFLNQIWWGALASELVIVHGENEKIRFRVLNASRWYGLLAESRTARDRGS
jgi:hypothetical protein